jgi:hypothetical protein
MFRSRVHQFTFQTISFRPTLDTILRSLLNTTKVPVAIHLRLNLYLIYIFKKKSCHHPPSHQRESENPGENPSAGFVRGMTRKTRRLNPRLWSLVKNAVAVVIRAACNLVLSQILFVHILGSAPNVKFAKFVKKKVMMREFYCATFVIEGGIWIVCSLP